MSARAYPASVRPRRERHRGGPAAPLGVAALCALAAAAVWVLAALVPATHLRDAILLHDFTLLGRPAVDDVARFLLHLLEPVLFVLWGVALLAVALARERPRVALAVAAVMAFAPLTAERLKPLAAHPHAHVDAVVLGAASWPSGHSTAALALVLSAVLVAPPRWRPLVACVGGAYALGVAVSLLILAWHMPSDVIGGFLVATLWMALAIAALREAERRWPSAPVRSPSK